MDGRDDSGRGGGGKPQAEVDELDEKLEEDRFLLAYQAWNQNPQQNAETAMLRAALPVLRRLAGPGLRKLTGEEYSTETKALGRYWMR